MKRVTKVCRIYLSSTATTRVKKRKKEERKKTTLIKERGRFEEHVPVLPVVRYAGPMSYN